MPIAFALCLTAALPLKAQTQSDGKTLAGTWQVEDVDQRGVLDRADLRLSFDTEGRVSGSSGCNRFTGRLSIEQARLSLSALSGTRKMCVSAALMDQEERLLRSLRAVDTLSWSDDGAAILSGPEGRRITLRRN